jgi:hypothetical protein
MSIKSLDTLITVTKNQEDGAIIDFTEPTFIPDVFSPNFTLMTIVEVSADYDRRPDLLAFALYGNDDYLDMILKINGISSPLDVRQGDFIMIPDKEKAMGFYVNPEKDPTEIKNGYLDETKKSKEDDKRIQNIAKIAANIKNGTKNIAKTNQLADGESNIKVNRENNTISF